MTTRQSRSGRAYTLRFLTAVAVYSVLMLLALPIARGMAPGPGRYAVAALPVIGVALGIRAVWRLLVEADEFQARKLLNSLAVSVALTILVSFVIGMAQDVGAPPLTWVWITPIWAIAFGIGTAWSSWRYR